MAAITNTGDAPLDVSVAEEIAVVCFANGAPGTTASATLTIDTHNDPAAPARFTVALAAQIIAGNVDADDGEYARRFTATSQAGSHEFTFKTVGHTRDGEPVQREVVRSKYVEGTVKEPPKKK